MRRAILPSSSSRASIISFKSFRTRTLARLGLTTVSAARESREAARRRTETLRNRLARLKARLVDSLASEGRLRDVYGSPGERLLSAIPGRLESIRATASSSPVAAREANLESISEEYRRAKRDWLEGTACDRARQVSIGGLRWSVPHDEGSPLSRRILNDQWLPLYDVALVRQYAVGGVMLDIGANVGTTSIPRVVLGDFDCAYCAEPDEANYACLVANALDNHLAGRILPERVAISSSVGLARLRRAEQIGGHKLVLSQKAADRIIDVPTWTLDAWIERLGVSPEAVNFVKIDTQGWDLHVLQGAPLLLSKRHIVWQIEVSPSMMRAAGSTTEDLCNLLEARFSHVRDLRSRKGRSQRASEVKEMLASLSERQFTNLLCLNRG